MTRHVDVLVIGAGPTGLSAARELTRRGADWHVLEAAHVAGGLAGSHVDAHGFTWDYGGHVLHSHYKSFDDAMNEALGEDGWLTHERSAAVRLHGRWVPYPFQLHLHHLSEDECTRALEGLRAAVLARDTDVAPPRHFDDWIVRSFGLGLADLFMRPYNRKVWAADPTQLGHAWIGDRVAVPDLSAIERAVATRTDTPPWGPNSVFRYPKHGGTGAPWRAVAAALPAERLHLGEPAVFIDTASHTVTTASGTRWRYNALISTLPLSRLLVLTGAPFDPGQLVYSSVDVVNVGIRGALPSTLRGRCWMYFPEPASPYFRVTVLSQYSPFNVPEAGAYWSLMTECSRLPSTSPDPLLSDRVIAALKRDDLLPEDAEIETTNTTALTFGYPTPFLRRDEVLHPMLGWLEERHIFSRGRFGAWKYEVSNQDHSFAQGRECVARVLDGGDESMEPTLHSPSVVNARMNA